MVGSDFFLSPSDYVKKKKETKYDLSKLAIIGEEVPFGVATLSGSDMETMPVRNISDALLNIPSVFIQQGGESIQASVASVFGASTNHTKLIFDGIELNTQLDGTADIAPFRKGMIDRVEVSNIPVSTLWGSGLGGVIYIKSQELRKDPGQGLCLDTSYGSFNTFQTTIDAALATEKSSWLFVPEYESSEGYKRGGESRRENYFIKGRYDLTDLLTFNLISGYVKGDLGEYEQQRFGRRSELESHTFFSGISLSLGSPDAQGLYSNFFLNGLKTASNRSYYFLGDDSGIPFSESPAHEQRLGERLTVGYKNNESAYTFEANHDSSDLDSSGFQGKKNVDANYISGSVDHSLSDRISGILGIRYDDVNAFGQETSYQAGLKWKDVLGWDTGATYSRDFNAPPLSYRFINDPLRGIKSNESLGAEYGHTVQFNAERKFFEKVLLQLTAYIQEMKDGIVLSQDRDGLFFFRNKNSLKRKGIESDLVYELIDKNLLRIGACFNDVIDKETNDFLNDRGRIRYTLGYDCSSFKGWNFNFTGYSTWWDMSPIYHSKERNFIFNMKVSHEISENFFVYGSVYNLFDQDLYWIDVYPNPPRNYEAGFKLKY